MNTDPSCIFCKIVQEEVPSHKIFEDDDFVAFLDIEPVNPGHTVLIPKKHSIYVWDMENQDLQAVMPIAKRIALALERTYNPKRVCLAVDGFDIAHAHIKVIPTYTPRDLEKETHPADHSELELEAKRIIQNLSE